MSDSSWSTTWRDIIVPLLCPEWRARTMFELHADVRPRRVLLRRVDADDDALVIR